MIRPSFSLPFATGTIPVARRMILDFFISIANHYILLYLISKESLSCIFHCLKMRVSRDSPYFGQRPLKIYSVTLKNIQLGIRPRRIFLARVSVEPNLMINHNYI